MGARNSELSSIVTIFQMINNAGETTERVGFEPTSHLVGGYTLSKRALSATQTPLHCSGFILYSHQRFDGGEGGIRTHEGLAALPLFESGAFNRTRATSPEN